MKKNTYFDHTRIRWGRELLGLLHWGVLVVAAGFIFGWESDSWKVVIAISLALSGLHSTVVVKRGTELDDMPESARTWHGTWVTAGVIGVLWFFSLLSIIWSLVTFLLVWLFGSAMFKMEREEREEMEKLDEFAP